MVCWLHSRFSGFLFFTSLSACSFPSMFICALTLWNVVGWVRVFNIFTMLDNMVLSAWLLC